MEKPELLRIISTVGIFGNSLIKDFMLTVLIIRFIAFQISFVCVEVNLLFDCLLCFFFFFFSVLFIPFLFSI